MVEEEAREESTLANGTLGSDPRGGPLWGDLSFPEAGTRGVNRVDTLPIL